MEKCPEIIMRRAEAEDQYVATATSIDLGRAPPPPAADNVFVVNQSYQSVAQPLSCSAKITGIIINQHSMRKEGKKG